MTLKHDVRSLDVPVELRAVEGGGTVAAGYAALFNSPTEIGGAWIETIARGAFSQALDGDVLALVDHNYGRVIGRTSAGTLRLKEDERGLAVEIDLPDTTDGRDLAVQLKRGDIKGMSFGFRVTHDEWDETVSPPARTIHEVELIEVSAVARPAYPDTELGLRSLETARKERRAHNFSHAARRLRMKVSLDLKGRE